MFMFKCIHADCCKEKQCIHIKEHRSIKIEHEFGDACTRGSRRCEYSGKYVTCGNVRDEKKIADDVVMYLLDRWVI
jgi:hypothetical protein